MLTDKIALNKTDNQDFKDETIIESNLSVLSVDQSFEHLRVHIEMAWTFSRFAIKNGS